MSCVSTVEVVWFLAVASFENSFSMILDKNKDNHLVHASLSYSSNVLYFSRSGLRLSYNCYANMLLSNSTKMVLLRKIMF